MDNIYPLSKNYFWMGIRIMSIVTIEVTNLEPFYWVYVAAEAGGPEVQ